MTLTPTAEPAAAPVPEHTHLGNYTAVAGCPLCARYGAINPDTLTPWPALGDHGEQVVAETADRFHDRYDGDNHAAALEAALREAYLRGKMQGRADARQDARRRAAAHRDYAKRQHDLADAAIKDDASTITVLSHTGLALSALTAARALEEV